MAIKLSLIALCISTLCLVSRCIIRQSAKRDSEGNNINIVPGSQMLEIVSKYLLTRIKRDTVNKQNQACELEVTNESVEMFSTDVLKHKYNFVHLNISFNGVMVREDDNAIMYNRWVWTYKGEHGGHEYLFLPNEFGYLSFGLLWSFTLVEPLPIEIRKKKHSICGNLIAGADADQKIGDALGNMTTKIASLNSEYNSSYWCYYTRLYIDSAVIFRACENAVCTMQTLEYRCCKFEIDLLTKKRHVECEKQHYKFGEIWWLLPILIGNTLFAFYPLLLTTFASRLRSFSVGRRQYLRSVQLEVINESKRSELTDFIRISKSKSPVTFLSTVFSPFCRCNTEGRIISRLIRITVIVLPLSLTMIRILLDYKYAGDFVKAAVEKGALVGFSTIIADFKSGSQYFLHYLGGPFVALPLFLVFGSLLIVIPYNFEEMLEAGLIEFSEKSSFLFTLSAESKARMGGQQIFNTTGYKRIQKTLVSQVLMLINRKFWNQTFKLFITRFTNKIYPTLKNITKNSFLAMIFGSILLVCYIPFCFTELMLALIFFAFPVMSCFLIFMKAYIRSTHSFLRKKTNCNIFITIIPTIIVILIFTYTWYLYCLIFFDSFWFLTKLVTFTYTGVIAYPSLSYGYMIIILMSLYYISESFKGFAQSYQELLSISMKACKKVKRKVEVDSIDVYILKDDGIPVDLWNLIVEKHRPKRIQVTYTLLKVLAIVSILTISLELLFRFDKLSDLPLITHVFIALVICAVPKIVKSLCTDGMRYRQQKKLSGKIKQTVWDYVNKEKGIEDSNIYVVQNVNEYEELED